MALKKRKVGKFHNKFCNVVDQLITLEELGFKEDWHNRWNYTIFENGDYSKSLLASGDYLYLRDQSGPRVEDVSLCVLWNRDIAGPIKKHEIGNFINMLREGNVRKEGL